MTQTQKLIKYCAIAFAIFLIFSIITGIASAIGLVGNIIFEETNNSETFNELNIDSNANVLDINLKATNLNIINGSELKAETDNEYVTITNKNNKLTITEKQHNIFNKTNNKSLTVYIPENLIFDAVSINHGAGNITIDTLNSKNLYLDLGAGNVTISDAIISRKTEIDGGAGELTINNGNLTNLELDLGIGDVKITSKLNGETDINTGVGSTTINVLGSKEDYQIEVDKGIGNVTIDGNKVKSEYQYGRGINKIDIDGGVGDIEVLFKKN